LTAVLAIEVTPRALAQLERAAKWWAENRLAAPGAIAKDFDAATKLLALQPGIGAKSTSRKYPGMRRLQLDRVRYDIYYQLEPGKVTILAFWHSSRGITPKL
jgi:plasmid stabilization system protein ParE